MFDMAHFYALADFSFVASVNIDSYGPLELSPYGKTKSSIVIEGRHDFTQELIMCADKYAWIVSACVPSNDNETTTITLLPFYTIFDRYIPYTAQALGVTMQIDADIWTYFKNCTDPMFAYPYIFPQTYSGASRYSFAPAVDESGLYNLKAYMDSMAPYVGAYLTWSSSGITITVIDREDYTYEFSPKYNTDGGAEKLLKAAFTRDLISKLTYFDKATGTSTDYYLLDDGTVSTDSTAPNRVRGRWILYEAESANIGLITAQFSRSEYSHAIELMTSQQAPTYYARCQIRLPSGEVIASRVTSISASSGDDRLKIKAGRAATTLSEIISEVQNAQYHGNG